MNIPVVLPVARIQVDDAGLLSASLDHEPYGDDRTLRRTDLQRLVEDIACDVGTSIKVEVTEADGTTYVDIATPADQPPVVDSALGGEEPIVAGVHGTGFLPGERVAVAYILLHETADAAGATAWRLPAAALGRRHETFLLVGLDSHIVTLIEDPR
jgi:hypothetical protein